MRWKKKPEPQPEPEPEIGNKIPRLMTNAFILREDITGALLGATDINNLKLTLTSQGIQNDTDVDVLLLRDGYLNKQFLVLDYRAEILSVGKHNMRGFYRKGTTIRFHARDLTFAQ
jgi:hypothetical protein